jgi:AbrB family looped-hinge helix DNA binding protein
MNDMPVPLFTPPDTVAQSPAGRMSLAPLPVRRSSSTELLSVAAIDRSGRFSVRRQVAALGWKPGSSLGFNVSPTAVLIRQTKPGRYRIHARGQLFLPSGARALLGLSGGDRVVVVAMPDHGALLVQPVNAVLGQIVEHCSFLWISQAVDTHEVHADAPVNSDRVPRAESRQSGATRACPVPRRNRRVDVGADCCVGRGSEG